MKFYKRNYYMLRVNKYEEITVKVPSTSFLYSSTAFLLILVADSKTFLICLISVTRFSLYFNSNLNSSSVAA